MGVEFEAYAAFDAEEALDLGEGVKLDLVVIPDGSFVMGSADGDADETSREIDRAGSLLRSVIAIVVEDQFTRITEVTVAIEVGAQHAIGCSHHAVPLRFQHS